MSDKSPLAYDPMDPDRPADWRFTLALALFGLPGPTPQHHDPFVARAVRAFGSEGRDPAVDEAEQLHDSPGVTRGEVEARIACDQPLDTIAAATGLPVDTVAVYEALFFDVRGRLADRPDLAGMTPGRPITRHDVRELVLLASAQLGPEAIGPVARYLRSGSAAGSAVGRGPGQALRQSIEAWIRRVTGDFSPADMFRADMESTLIRLGWTPGRRLPVPRRAKNPRSK